MEVRDPRIGMVTLTGVEVSSDFAHAKIFYTTLAEGDARREVAQGLKRAAGHLRSLLGARIKVHATPQLRFIFDDSVERGTHLSQLIDKALSEPKPEGKPEE